MSGGRIFPVCPLIQSNINYPELFKSDDQKSINSSKVISNINYTEMLNTEMLKSDEQKSPLLESTSSEPKQDPNHIMISPKFHPTVDMIELISKKSPMAEFQREYLMRLSFIEKAGNLLTKLPKLKYRRIAKEALRVRNEMYSEETKSKCYPKKFNGGKNIKQYAVKSLRNTLRLEHKEAMSFIHELKILREVSHPKFYGVYKEFLTE
ncbi:hypothetical protein C2G38_2193217 [Gigaspora rosea]|uniref:Uncharacterized protein n=1 Tax=Gigaspora rosea TaxID=44941 RepID=A0A397V583_9GLOM|nr:hypothetical protein C2G38_2193217 [Gigaspora rosea]